MLSRTMHGIAYDPIHQEFFVTAQFGQAVLVFRSGAGGEERPIRVIHGSKTRLVEPDTLAVDPVHDEIFVPEGENILVYPRTANGNVAPSRVITGLGTVGSLAVDPQRDLIVVNTQDWEPDPTLRGRGNDEDNRRNLLKEAARPTGRLSIIPRASTGTVKPLRVITGMLNGGNLAIHSPTGLVFMIQRAIAGGEGAWKRESYVAVWHIDDSGRVPPRYKIGGRGVMFRGMGLALDPKNEAVIVSDKDLNAVLTFHVPEVFAPQKTTSSGQ